MKNGKMYLLFALFLAITSQSFADVNGVFYDEQANLMRDLMVARYWDCRSCERFPAFNNHLMYTGYFNMPSARMGEEGEVAIGYSWVSPYHIWGAKAQLLPQLEISGNYRVFSGIKDPVLSPHGFGDFADKGANVKFALFRPEDSEYRLPGVAIGFEDFLGTRCFKAGYVAFTHVFLNHNVEATLGYGWDRFRHWFGGVAWMPFRHPCFSPMFRRLALVAEYDPIPYEDKDIEPHPKGREKKSSINFGIKYRLRDYLDLSLSYVRGMKLSGSISVFYNFGETKGFVPKIDDPLPYQAPVNMEPLGCLRPEEVLVQDLLYAFRRQGFDLLEAWLSCNDCGEKILRIHITNNFWRTEPELRNRINHLLAYLIPIDIEHVIVTLEAEGFPIQEYHYRMPFMREWGVRQMGTYELKILTPLREASCANPYCERLLLRQRRELINFELLPKLNTFFGSAAGKFKYSAGISCGINGYLWGDIYYSALVSYNMFTDLDTLNDIDKLNPSQIINVRTDLVSYLKREGVTIDELFLQKNWNMGCGWYSRLAMGYFEEMYGGLAAECLWYPVGSRFAFGVEGAVLKKRRASGLGFTDKIRKLKGFCPTHRQFLGSQFFLDLYYDWIATNLDLKLQAGKFLANDWGARFEVSRYFKSGLRVTMWYTWTNGNDKVNGETYHDKGVAFSMPLDIFYTHSARDRFSDSMSAWLRDVGVTSCTGIELYNLIHEHRDDHF